MEIDFKPILKYNFRSFMKELASQKIEEKFGEEKVVFYYRRYLNMIQISNQDTNFSVFAIMMPFSQMLKIVKFRIMV